MNQRKDFIEKSDNEQFIKEKRENLYQTDDPNYLNGRKDFIEKTIHKIFTKQIDDPK